MLLRKTNAADASLSVCSASHCAVPLSAPSLVSEQLCGDRQGTALLCCPLFGCAIPRTVAHLWESRVSPQAITCKTEWHQVKRPWKKMAIFVVRTHKSTNSETVAVFHITYFYWSASVQYTSSSATFFLMVNCKHMGKTKIYCRTHTTKPD